MKKIIIESPLAGDVKRNIEYARKCVSDSLSRGEAPFAGHLLYPQEGILDDTKKFERVLGMEAALVWGKEADMTVVYEDYGISSGMKVGIERAKKEGRPIEYRKIL
jgi:hypothetical protein